MSAWQEQRDLLREHRARCFAEIADALGCTVADLPARAQRAVTLFGHECYQAALAYAHERQTVPVPSSQRPTERPPGAYHETPTRADRVRLRQSKS